MDEQAKGRWAAHAATAKELAKIEKQLKDINSNLVILIGLLKKVIK